MAVSFIAADILQEFRKAIPAGHLHVGWCRVAQGWRWRVCWSDASEMEWSVAAYRTRPEAAETALSILLTVEAALAA